jgi:membrane-bound lytic murein transglycosylase D
LRNAPQRIAFFNRVYLSLTFIFRITASPSENKGKRQIYTVEKGDSLWSISQKFSGISVKKLQDWNGISGKNLKAGMRIIVSN